MDAVLCCIAKLEGPYILEWVTYHLKMGFSRIYIYDNNANKTRLRSYFLNRTLVDQRIADKVSIIHFPGKAMQMQAYNEFLTRFSNRHKWVAILDCDEFIVLKNWEPITSFLSKKCQSGALSLNWRIFGDNGRTTYSSEPVTERFTMAWYDIFNHVKTISVCKHVECFADPHHSILKNGVQRDINGTIFQGSIIENGNSPLNVAYICHYFGKTIEEWNIKQNRGNADGMPKRKHEEFNAHNKNEVEDLSAHNFYTDPTLDFFT
jgi:hypothetical protein